MPDDPDVQAKIQSSARRARRKADTATAAAQRELDLGGFSPVVVGLLRGLIHAMIMGGLSFVTTTLSTQDTGTGGTVGAVATIGVAVVRAVEGLLDGKLLGAPRSARPLGGGRPAK